MKKFTIIPAVLGILCGVMIFTSAVNKEVEAAIYTYDQNDEWTKTKSGMWPGLRDGKTYWYKLDKDAKLSWSTDGKSWSQVANGMWADKSGRWMKVENQKLVWSTDMGTNWSDVPEGRWEGSDSRWYKFDKDWTLMVKK